ncbi:MAG TPA: metallophosphoesterase, partial [Longimicrobiaceae bacterium]
GVADENAWKSVMRHLLDEYEYEYGARHRPFATSASQSNSRRAEVLHPLFVQSRRLEPLSIGHITDTHVDVRADVYEENLKVFRHPKWTATSFNNWNKSFLRCYDHAKQDSDVVLLTGDLIDYGRGHWGLDASHLLGSDQHYHEDRNWFLFYYLLARRLANGEAYTKPVYTILGNHDWRLNPYPPFAVAGAPSPKTLIHNYWEFTAEERRRILQIAHGKGYERKFSYNLKAGNYWDLFWEQPRGTAQVAWELASQTRTMDKAHTPTDTTVESVAWYLLSINPFFDYSFALPSQHKVLMLDWAKDEDVLFPIAVRGQTWPYLFWQAGEASEPGPMAQRCLTPLQKSLVERFTTAPGAAKVIGIHAPPIGPWPDWYDGELVFGFKVNELYDPYDRKLSGNAGGARGPTVFAVENPDGGSKRGHPLYAIQPPGGPAGVVADYNSFESSRDWFIRQVAESRAGVRLVLSGHIHRNGLFVVYTPGADTLIKGKAVAGQLLVRGLTPGAVRGAPPPAVAIVPEGRRGPLYVNTTSAGPRGNSYSRQGADANVNPGYAHAELAADGTIRAVAFRSLGVTVAQPPAVTPGQRPAIAVTPAAPGVLVG